MQPEREVLYVCERCFSAAERPGPCPRCGDERRRFEVGAPDDPRRRPPIDAEGHVLCRAPLWWVDGHSPYLRR